MTRRGRDDGYTLIEMLVSLALLGLAAMLMLTGFASGRRLTAGSEARTARAEQVEAVQTILRDRIERLRPVTRTDGLSPYADFDGSAAQLTFLSLPPDAQRPARLQRFRLRRDDNGNLMLGRMLASSPILDNDSNGDYAETILMHGVEGLTIRYFGPDSAGRLPDWQSGWTRRDTAPQLVRIDVRLPSGDRRGWPELIVRPRATVDTRCTLDATTGACRGRG